MFAQMLKRLRKWMGLLEHVVLAVGCGGMADNATTKIASTGKLKVLFQPLILFRAVGQLDPIS